MLILALRYTGGSSAVTVFAAVRPGSNGIQAFEFTQISSTCIWSHWSPFITHRHSHTCTHLVAIRRKRKTCMEGISMRVKRQGFLYAVFSDSSLFNNNSIPTLVSRQERIGIPHSPVGVMMWVFCVFTVPPHVSVQYTCLFCAVWVLCRQRFLHFEALGKNLSPPAPAPFFLSPAGPNLHQLQDFFLLLIPPFSCAKRIVSHVGSETYTHTYRPK